MQLLEVIVHLFHPRRSNNHRARILHPESIFSLSLVIIGFGIFLTNAHRLTPQMSSILGYASDIQVEQVVAQTNEERAKSGLGTVKLNGTLSSAARAKAADMFEHQYWSHISPAGKQPWDFMKEAKYDFSSAGENLARDFSTTPEMIAAWMGSPSHKANIMYSKYQEIGVAVVNGTLQGVETTLVVQMFGRPSQAVAQVPSDAAQKTTTVPAVPAVQVAVQPAEIAPVSETTQPGSDVLADTVISIGTIESNTALSPQQVMKAVFLSILVVILVTLVYDAYVTEQKNTVRVVGKNFGHILFFLAVAAVVLYFKSGAILTVGAMQ
jgi:hypothetical protein